jgi:hypothetical protein
MKVIAAAITVIAAGMTVIAAPTTVISGHLCRMPSGSDKSLQDATLQ